jgi:hypothetical protein
MRWSLSARRNGDSSRPAAALPGAQPALCGGDDFFLKILKSCNPGYN